MPYNRSPATRYITRHKAREVAVIEAEAKSIDVRIIFHLSSPSLLNFVVEHQ